MTIRPALLICSALLLPSCAPYHLGKGNSYLDQGNLTAAEAEYREAGDWTSSKLNLAVVMMKQGRLAEARALLEPLSVTDPYSPSVVYFIPGLGLKNSGEMARYNLSLVYSDLAAERLTQGKVSEALKFSELAVKNDPENLYAAVNRGISLLRSGDRASGAAVLTEVARSPKAEALTVADGRGGKISLKRLAESHLGTAR